MTKLSKITRTFFVVLICLGFVNGVCFGSKSGNLEYWQTQAVSVDINKDFYFNVSQELRFGRHHGNPYLHNIDLALVYKSFADWVDIGFNFKKEYEQDSTGKFRQENRPHLNVTLKGKLLGLDLSDRSRFEYRDRENKKDLWRYRNKVTVKFPLELTSLKLQPYLADEVFINFDEEDFNRNRLYAGLSLKLSKNIKAEVYYLWQSSESGGEWEDINVLGTQLRFHF